MITKLKRYLKSVGQKKLLAWWVGGCAGFLALCPYAGLWLALPAIIYVLWIYRSRIDFGGKWLIIPLLVIIISIIASHNWFAIVVAFYLFGIYLVARILGRAMFTPFMWGIGAYFIFLIIHNLIIMGGLKDSGIVNFHCGAELLIIGAVTNRVKYQWILLTIVGLSLFIGASEIGWIATGIVLVIMIIRKDMNRTILIPIGITLAVIILGIYPFKYTERIYFQSIDKVKVAVLEEAPTPYNEYTVVTLDENPTMIDTLLNNRIYVIKEQLSKISVLGIGYNMYPYNYPHKEPIHNVPLVIVQQVGIAATLAWLVVTIYSVRKTKYIYAFAAMMTICLVDHSMWTAMGSWWFMIVGISSIPNQKKDYLFKDEKHIIQNTQRFNQ